ALLLSALFLMAPEDFGNPPPPWWASEIVAANLVITLAVLVVLALSRQEFYARVQRGSLRQALSVLVALLAVCTVIGWGLVEAFPGDVDRDGRLPYALERVLGGAFAFH